MASEFTINFSVSYASTSGGGLTDSIAPAAIVKDQTAVGFHSVTQSVTTGTTTLEVLENAATAGRLFLKNLDADNSVNWGSTLREFSLVAGDIAWVNISSSTAVINIEASTGTVKVFAKVFEA